MAIPIPPLAAIALRYAAVAGAAYVAARRMERARLSQAVEDEMDATPDGIQVRRAEDQVNATARTQRIVRLGRVGPGVRIDATLLARLRMERAR